MEKINSSLYSGTSVPERPGSRTIPVPNENFGEKTSRFTHKNSVLERKFRSPSSPEEKESKTNSSESRRVKTLLPLSRERMQYAYVNLVIVKEFLQSFNKKCTHRGKRNGFLVFQVCDDCCYLRDLFNKANQNKGFGIRELVKTITRWFNQINSFEKDFSWFNEVISHLEMIILWISRAKRPKQQTMVSIYASR